MLPEANYTQFPNCILDQLHELSGAEFKVISTIVRQTIGYHRREHQISLSFLSKACNLSRQGTVDAISALIERNWIKRVPIGQNFLYSIKLVNSVDQSSDLTSQLSRPALVNSVDQSVEKLVNSVDTNKESNLNKDKQRCARTKKAKKKTGFDYDSLPEHDAFNSFWNWYRQLAKDTGSNPGDKQSAAKSWMDALKIGSLDDIRKGCAIFAKQSRKTDTKVPHACRFLIGAPRNQHPSPYWKSAIEDLEPIKNTDFATPVAQKSSTQELIKARLAQEGIPYAG